MSGCADFFLSSVTTQCLAIFVFCVIHLPFEGNRRISGARMKSSVALRDLELPSRVPVKTPYRGDIETGAFGVEHIIQSQRRKMGVAR